MSIFVDIEKKIGSFHLNVQFETGDDTLALLGASGCGKSMTLRCIAGIERPDRGRIVVNGVTLFDSARGIDLPPQQRGVGLLFQNYALFPHMTVRENIRAGACREADRRKREALTDDIMARFGLTALAKQYPRELSGGEQQRTALARIMVSAPEIILLDEPFSALDCYLRFRMEQDVRTALRAFGRTVLLVSHDRDEVFRMSDRIAIMANGTVEAIGEKQQVFEDPVTRAGALLTGCKNISAVTRTGADTVFAADWGISLRVPQLTDAVTAIGIRMRQIRAGKGENSFRCRVVEEIEDPFSFTLLLRPVDAAEGSPIGWVLPKEAWQGNRADEVEISLPLEAILCLRG